MKKLALLIVSLFFLFSFGLVFAQAQDAQFALPQAGITPDSFWYFLDRFFEALQEFFTFNPGGKARLQITFAAERIAEIKVLLETKGADARGLDVAQSRLQAHIAKAANIIVNQEAAGRNVSALAQELDDNFDGPKSALFQTLKEQIRELETREDELKSQLRAAHRAGDTAREEAIAGELGQVKGQLELLELREEDLEKGLEAEEERIEEEMEAQYKAQKAIAEAEKEKQEVLDEAAEEDVELPPDAFSEFDSLLSQAKAAFDTGDFQEARRLAKQAEESLEQVEDVIEELEGKKETKEEAEEAIADAEAELEEAMSEAEEKGLDVPPEALGDYNSSISQARAALEAENYEEAKRLAEQAEESLEGVEKVIEELEEAQEEEAEAIEEEQPEEEEVEEIETVTPETEGMEFFGPEE